MPQVGALARLEPYHCQTADEVWVIAYRVFERKKQAPRAVRPLLIEFKPAVVAGPAHSDPACKKVVARFWVTAAQRIMETVAEKHGFTPAQMLFRRRLKPLVIAKHEAMYEMYLKTDYSLPMIGKKFGGMDHTAVLYGIRAHAQRNGLELLNGHERQVRR